MIAEIINQQAGCKRINDSAGFYSMIKDWVVHMILHVFNVNILSFHAETLEYCRLQISVSHSCLNPQLNIQ